MRVAGKRFYADFRRETACGEIACDEEPAAKEISRS